MFKYRFVIGLVVLITFAFVSLSIAMISVGGSNTAPAPSSGVSKAPAATQTKILKVVGIVARISNNTLYLQNKKKYDLRNVKVTYNQGKRISEKKRTAEMYFVNDILKEVIIN